MFIKLERAQFPIIAEIIDYAGLESVFAYSVIDSIIPGNIYVDDSANPNSVFICTNQGKYLVAGDETNDVFNTAVAKFLLDASNHIQSYDLYTSSEEWIEVLSKSLDGQAVILRYTIYYSKKITTVDDIHLENGFELKPIDEILFEKIVRDFYPSYKNLWGSAAEFCSKSFGFCIVKNDDVLSVATAVYIGNGYAEIDIETSPYYYRKGLAYALANQFIKYCQDNNLVALWICDSLNKKSKALAEKLELTRAKEVEMFWWHENRSAMNGYLNKFNS